MNNLAYFVEDDPEEKTGEVIFFVDEVSAKEYQEEYEEEYNLLRMPEWDKYSKLGYIPAEKWIENHGSWLECNHCNKIVDQEKWDYENDMPLTPVYVKNILYCSKECLEEEQVKLNRNKQSLDTAIKTFTNLFPFCIPIIPAYFYRQNSTFIEFEFEGGKGCWNGDDPDYVCIASVYIEEFNKAKKLYQDSLKNN